MKIYWENSNESEVRRIVHTAHQMVIGFYRLHGFTVLPYSQKQIDINGNFVFLPEIDYQSIPRFWEKVKSVDAYHMSFEIDEKIMVGLSVALGELSVDKPKISLNNKIWNELESEFFEATELFIPGLKDKIDEIFVYPTAFGTKCSFSVPTDGERKLIVYLRYDQDTVYGLAEAILSALTRESVYKKLEGSWAESEMLVDWLITESSIGKVLNKYHDLNHYFPTIKNIRFKQQANLLKQSDEFYHKLGLPSFEKPFKLFEGKPTIFGKTISNLSPHEDLVLIKLIENENKLTTIDEIGGIIAKNEDDFSLYAIAKTIQRIRDKIEGQGLSGSFIQTMRGKGYMLKN